MAKDKPKKQKEGGRSPSQKKAKSTPPPDLDRLKNTTATQAPKSSSAAAAGSSAPVRTRVVRASGPKLDWKFAIFSGLAAMFVGLVTQIFGINDGLVLNDRFNLAYLMNKELMNQISQNILVDMLGVNPLSQPWLKASFIGDFSEYHLNFVWYHAVEVFWHATTVGLIFLFVLTVALHMHHQNRLKLNPHYVACVTAVLFACHPLACETVTYLSARSPLLGTMNYFLALDCFLLASLIKHPVARAAFGILALYTGAMSVWSNPECMTLPAMALFSLLLMKRPLAKWKETVKEHPVFSGASLLSAILLPCLVVRGVEYTAAINLFLPTLSPGLYVASQFKALVFYYLRCALVPLGLSVDPPLAVATSLTDPLVYAAIAVIAGIVYMLVTKLRQPILGLSGALVVLGFLPHMFMVQPDVVADWVAYLPLSGIMMFVAYGLCTLAQRNLRNSAIILVCITLLFMDLSICRNSQWSSGYGLWESAELLRPKSAVTHAMLASEYLKREQLDEAEKEAKLAIAYGPELVIGRIAQAKVLAARDRFKEANEVFTAALSLADAQKLAPVAKTECKLGQLQCLIGEKKDKEANALLTKLIPEVQDEPRLLYMVGMAAFENKDYEKAFKYLDKAVASDPSLSESWRPMAESALLLHAYEPAYQAAHNYMDILGGPYSMLLFCRAAILTKRENEAEDVLKVMLKKYPQDARVPYLLSRLYKRTGKTENWKKYRDDAIKLDPEIAVKFALPELDAEESANPEGKPQQSESGTAETNTTTPPPANQAPAK